MPIRGVLAAALSCGLVACGMAPAPVCPQVPPQPMPPPPWHDDSVLEERIPDELDGQSLEVQTYCASAHPQEGGLTTAPEFLDEIGVDLTDVTVARSRGPSIGGDNPETLVAAWRYHGADETLLRSTFLRMYDEVRAEEGLPGAFIERTMAGKTVHEDDIGVVYVADDTIYVVHGRSTEELVAGLP